MLLYTLKYIKYDVIRNDNIFVLKKLVMPPKPWLIKSKKIYNIRWRTKIRRIISNPIPTNDEIINTKVIHVTINKHWTSTFPTWYSIIDKWNYWSK